MPKPSSTPKAGDPVEVVAGVMQQYSSRNGYVPARVQAAVTPTQVRRPWRSTARTVFQGGVALASLLPLVVTEVYTDADAAPAAVAQVLVVCGAVSRVMAMPSVEQFLRRFLPFLAAAPKPE